MEKQVSFSDIDFQNKKKKTKKELFLEKMSQSVPLKLFCDLIQPFYYKNGNGRHPIPLEIMVKMYLVSNWYNLSDESTEDLLYDSLTVKNYVGVTNNVPDATTLGKFRVEIIERNNLNKQIFDELNKRLTEQGILLREGTIVDATIITAQGSTKTNPEMSTTIKGGKEYFGIKAHIGVDKNSGLVHSVAVTTARAHDVTAANSVLHGDEKEIFGDAGYTGIDRRPEVCERFHDGTGEMEYYLTSKGVNKKRKIWLLKKRELTFHINAKKSKVFSPEQALTEVKKSHIRSKVEHSFGLLKHIFGFRQTRYKTLAKNENKLFMMFALANIFRCSQKQIIHNIG
jgi:IS5 family transposase